MLGRSAHRRRRVLRPPRWAGRGRWVWQGSDRMAPAEQWVPPTAATRKALSSGSRGRGRHDAGPWQTTEQWVPAAAVVATGVAATTLDRGRQGSNPQLRVHPPSPKGLSSSARELCRRYADTFGLRLHCRATVPRAGSACPAPLQQCLLASPLEWPSRATIRKYCRLGLWRRWETEYGEREIAMNDRRTFDECFYSLLLLLMEDKGGVCSVSEG